MKIIEYTLGLPPYRRGGLPRYSLDLATELAKDNDVYLLYPGQMMPNAKTLKFVEVPTNFNFITYEMKNPLPVSLDFGINNEEKYYEKRDVSQFKKLIDEIKPDVFHLHTLMGLPVEMLKYIKDQDIKIVYTTHDYYGLCPKMLASDPQVELENDRCTDDCILCPVGPSYAKVVVMQSHLYQRFKESQFVKAIRKREKRGISTEQKAVTHFSLDQIEQRQYLREYYLSMFELVDEFHFNSTVAKNYYRQFLPQAKGKVIPITHADLEDLRSKHSNNLKKGPIKIGYVGAYNHKKGFDLLKKVLLKIDRSDTWQADFYGDIIDDALFQRRNIINHGIISPSRISKALSRMDVLIIPSQCFETFGFIGLEALLVGTPCLMSNRVGAKDLVPKNWIFQSETNLQQELIDVISNPNKVSLMKRQVQQLELNYSMIEHTRLVYKLF